MKTPRRVAPANLQIGRRYLHQNGLFVRQIDAIEGDLILWHDKVGPGTCTKKVFLRQCPSLVPEDAAAPKEQEAVPRASQTTDAEFTIRDEANAITAFAFRNGFLEDLHAGKSSPLLEQPGYSRISDDEMRRLMIEASEKLQQMLRLKRDEPAKYDMFIREYQRMYCRAWKRD
jgi:hypothetical protein